MPDHEKTFLSDDDERALEVIESRLVTDPDRPAKKLRRAARDHHDFCYYGRSSERRKGYLIGGGFALGVMSVIAGIVFAADELNGSDSDTTEARRKDAVVLALHDPWALRYLGICAKELRAESVKAQDAYQFRLVGVRLGADGPVPAGLQEQAAAAQTAALLAEAHTIPCTPPDGSRAYVSYYVSGMVVSVTEQDVLPLTALG